LVFGDEPGGDVENSEALKEVLAAISASEARLSSRLGGLADRLEAIASSLARVESKVDFIGTKLLNPMEQKAIGIGGSGLGGGPSPVVPMAAKPRE
jgi:hypothetical protein